VGETTGSACIGACRDAVVGCGVAFHDAVVGCGVAFCDAVMGGIMDVTTDSYRGEACRDAVLGGIMDVTTDPDCRGVAYHDAFLEGTVDVTTGPFLCVIDTVGVTTGLYLAILRCDATMLFLDGDIMGETTNSLIMSLYSPCRWAIMYCVGSMPW